MLDIPMELSKNRVYSKISQKPILFFETIALILEFVLYLFEPFHKS